MIAPLLELRAVRREYPTADGTFAALNAIDLIINAGEMIAIMGPSGSGKSTLMNILGCLDPPTSGVYRVAGQEIANLDSDALAVVRRERFGFIFQRYNLLADLTATGNVEIPAVYAGVHRQERHVRAVAILRRLKLDDRLDHLPRQLSGGQQQRVSIARALMNGGEILLADEPTGALDSQVGLEVINVLNELHALGHTIVLVTHDPEVAAHAERIIELYDGKIVSDRRTSACASRSSMNQSFRVLTTRAGQISWRHRSFDALCMAFLALRAHPLRTFLTMLGIIIGIASVVCVVALATGAREQVLSDIRGMGTNTLDIYPGKGRGDERAAGIHTLDSSDAAALAQQHYIDSLTPSLSTPLSIRFGSVSIAGTINGVGEQFFRVHDVEILQGQAFSRADTRDLAQVALIDEATRQRLFVREENPIGQVILLGEIPVRVIGVAKSKESLFASSQNLNVWMPYTAVIGRVLGPSSLSGVTARIRDDVLVERATDAITRLLVARHGRKDFYIFNPDTIKKTIESTGATLSLLISSIAVISLIVGGIGVMNIMLVSVTERTREIGIRAAVGATQSDILQQFLIEAVFVCLIGGTVGVILALGIGVVHSHFTSSFLMAFSPFSIFAALAVSSFVGVTFGYLPARRAAQLNPVEALARE
jgi:macrolide transport system ATP-binding/permease protein